jgi:hypothetical protein
MSRDATPHAYKPSDWTMVLDHNPVMIAAGAIIGLRTTVSMLVASIALAYVIGPWGHDIAWTSPVTHNLVYATSAPGKAWKEIGVWLGVPIMVSSGLLAFAMQWRTIARAFSGFGRATPSGGHEELVAATEVPTSWFAIGTAITGAGVIAIASAFFGVPWYYGILAVGMTFFLSLVACRATGETDITPIGAMGKTCAHVRRAIPQSTTANLMTASITASASGASADLLNDPRRLLGGKSAPPVRRADVGPCLARSRRSSASILVPDADDWRRKRRRRSSGTAAQTWKAVVRMFAASGTCTRLSTHRRRPGDRRGPPPEVAPPKIRPWPRRGRAGPLIRRSSARSACSSGR